MGFDDLAQVEALGCLGRIALLAGRHVRDLHVVVAEHDGLEAGSAGDGVAVLLDALDVFGDHLIGDEGADAVVDQHDGVPGVLLLRLLQGVVNSVLGSLTALHHGGHLLDVVLLQKLLHVGDVVLQHSQVDLVDLLVVLKLLDGVDQNGLSVDLQKLLGDTGAHADAAAAGKKDRNIHN